MKLEFTTRDKEEIVAQYLVAEFEVLNQRAIQHNQVIASKVNFYLAIVTAIAGGLLVAGSSDQFRPYLLPVACLALGLSCLLGIATLSQVLDLVASSRVLLRRAGRIRKWFLDFDASLLPYLPFKAADDRPSFYVRHARLRDVESSLLLGNAAAAATLAGLLFFLGYSILPQSRFLHEWVPYLIALGINVAVFILSWMLQTRHIHRFLYEVEREEVALGDVHFTSDSTGG